MPQKIKPPDGYLTIQEYATLHEVSPDAVYYWLHAGSIPYVKVGERRFVKLVAKPPRCPTCGKKK